MDNKLEEIYHRDRGVWDECAEVYEKQIVGGHPDIAAFEAFEEDFLEEVLRYLADEQERPIKLMDIGCGSGRLHSYFGAKTIQASSLPESSQIRQIEECRPSLAFDDLLAERLCEVWGIDFSQSMIDLAQRKHSDAGFEDHTPVKLTFEQGSAFELAPEDADVLPVAVCLVNSIGVMQGHVGAAELFMSMRRAVEDAGGIAIISAYQQEYVASYALGQYESTLDVSGQPRWMAPDTYASENYRQVSRAYKRAYSEDRALTVDVFDTEGSMVKKGHILTRDPEAVRYTIETGDIRTFTDYKSNWYSFNQFEEWIRKFWSGRRYHIKTKELDAIRAEPAQMAILDYRDHLKDLFIRLGCC